MNVLEEIERLRVKLPLRPNSPTGPRVERMIELYETLSLKEVSEAMGCHLETVRYHLKRRGVPIRPPHKNIRPHSGHNLGLTYKRQARRSQDQLQCS